MTWDGKKYDSRYREIRARLVKQFRAGQRCPQTFVNGTVCGRPISAYDEIELGHADNGVDLLGLVHKVCNRRAAAMRKNVLYRYYAEVGKAALAGKPLPEFKPSPPARQQRTEEPPPAARNW